MSKGPETIAEPGLLLFFFAVIPRLLLFIRYHLLVPFKEKRVLSKSLSLRQDKSFYY